MDGVFQALPEKAPLMKSHQGRNSSPFKRPFKSVWWWSRLASERHPATFIKHAWCKAGLVFTQQLSPQRVGYTQNTYKVMGTCSSLIVIQSGYMAAVSQHQMHQRPLVIPNHTQGAAWIAKGMLVVMEPHDKNNLLGSECVCTDKERGNLADTVWEWFYSVVL